MSEKNEIRLTVRSEYSLTELGKKLHLHKMILVIDGVNESVLSVML